MTTTKPTESVDLDRLELLLNSIATYELPSGAMSLIEQAQIELARASQPAPVQQGVADERELFEQTFDNAKGRDGTQHDVIGWYYFDDEIEAMWKAWQAARATQPVGHPDFHFQQSAPNSAPTAVSGQGETAPAANAVGLLEQDEVVRAKNVVDYIERFDGHLIAEGFDHAQRMKIVGILVDTCSEPVKQAYRTTAEKAGDQAELDAQLRQEVTTMYQMLDDGEWAEHIAVTPHGQCLETAITKLVGKADRAPAADRAALKDGEA